MDGVWGSLGLEAESAGEVHATALTCWFLTEV